MRGAIIRVPKPHNKSRSRTTLSHTSLVQINRQSIGLFAGWFAGCDVLRRALKAEENNLMATPGALTCGMPRWRCVTGIYFQGTLVALAAATAASSAATAGTLSTTFLLSFAGFMLYDFATIDFATAPSIAAHHAACLFCHGYVVYLGTAAAFPWYLRGVATLEAGSGLCNLHFLWPEDRRLRQLYLGGMTVSNLATLYCMRHWVHATASPAGKALGAFVTCGLVIGRQQVAWEANQSDEEA